MAVAEIIPTYTPEDLLRMPDNSTMELVDGQIVEKPVSAESSKIEGRFYFCFETFLLNNPVAEVYPASLGYQCFDGNPTKIRKPDTTVIRLDRLNKLRDPNPGYMPIVPDLAVEVISPNDVVYDVDEKIREYLDAGFPLVWLADPKARTVTVYPRNGRPVIHTADDELTAEAVLPGFRCKVGDFFPPRQVRSPQSI
ncbi:MAG TPA: Uma2 family endonuclease [Tepidisphaeraceae bacterium]|jgi:Uma2 family endonuclease|nr:Uma2 family endonuclease [Tepidisphaeraceae bacterium]